MDASSELSLGVWIGVGLGIGVAVSCIVGVIYCCWDEIMFARLQNPNVLAPWQVAQNRERARAARAARVFPLEDNLDRLAAINAVGESESVSGVEGGGPPV